MFDNAMLGLIAPAQVRRTRAMWAAGCLALVPLCHVLPRGVEAFGVLLVLMAAWAFLMWVPFELVWVGTILSAGLSGLPLAVHNVVPIFAIGVVPPSVLFWAFSGYSGPAPRDVKRLIRHLSLAIQHFGLPGREPVFGACAFGIIPWTALVVLAHPGPTYWRIVGLNLLLISCVGGAGILLSQKVTQARFVLILSSTLWLVVGIGHGLGTESSVLVLAAGCSALLAAGLAIVRLWTTERLHAGTHLRWRLGPPNEFGMRSIRQRVRREAYRRSSRGEEIGSVGARRLERLQAGGVFVMSTCLVVVAWVFVV